MCQHRLKILIFLLLIKKSPDNSLNAAAGIRGDYPDIRKMSGRHYDKGQRECDGLCS